jgi:hypothetical protein
MSYVALKKVVLVSLTLYAASAWYAHFFAPNENLYPLFSWNLFSYIPNEVQTYTITILSYNHTIYNPPLAFDKKLFLLSSVNRSPNEFIWEIGELGRAFEAQDTDAIKRGRTLVETLFRGMPARYEVHHATYDPLTYWKTDAFKEMRMIGVVDTSVKP